MLHFVLSFSLFLFSSLPTIVEHINSTAASPPISLFSVAKLSKGTVEPKLWQLMDLKAALREPTPGCDTLRHVELSKPYSHSTKIPTRQHSEPKSHQSAAVKSINNSLSCTTCSILLLIYYHNFFFFHVGLTVLCLNMV